MFLRVGPFDAPAASPHLSLPREAEIGPHRLPDPGVVRRVPRPHEAVAESQGRRGVSPDTTWAAIDGNLQKGARGLPGGSSLAKLLLEHRGVRHHLYLPPLTVHQILAWADEHHQRTGGWPLGVSGDIPKAPGETWRAVEKALRKGRRGLPGGETLARFLERQRGARNHLYLPPLTTELILTWADYHHRRTGRWPVQAAGPVHGIPDQTWNAVDSALIVGCRGLPGGESLAGLLEKHRGVRNHMRLPDYTPERILAWAMPTRPGSASGRPGGAARSRTRQVKHGWPWRRRSWTGSGDCPEAIPSRVSWFVTAGGATSRRPRGSR